VSRFFLSTYAKADLLDIESYLWSVPIEPQRKIARALQEAFRKIAENPLQGAGQSELTRLAGTEVRSWLVLNYRIFYTVGKNESEILAVLHTARNIAGIMAKRLQ
jgi:plasmid stabilization system protein ParE